MFAESYNEGTWQSSGVGSADESLAGLTQGPNDTATERDRKGA